jgi:aspartate kinase
MIKVFKFGGASVKDPDSVRNVARVLSLFKNDKLAVVVSAMGKTTNAFERLLYACYFNKGKMDEEFNFIRDFHLKIIEGLFTDKNHSIFSDMESIFRIIWERVNLPHSDNYDYDYDQLVSAGEIISTKIISEFLNSAGIKNRWIDARRIIRTDNTYREARVDWVKTEELVQNEINFNDANIYVTQGFIGGTSENLSTTLGREGSDFSAAILAYCLHAVDVTIWKDVPGVLNADPKYFDNTVKLDRLSYYDAIELAYYGASVIHPKTIKPLQNKGIPLWVKSFVDPDEKGTIVHTDKVELKVPSFIFKMNQVLVTVAARDFSFIVEQNLRDIFHALSEARVRINVMQNTALSFSISADWDERKVMAFIASLEQDYMIKYNQGLELVTIRNYDQATIERVTVNKEVILEEKSRNTVQMVMRDINNN